MIHQFRALKNFMTSVSKVPTSKENELENSQSSLQSHLENNVQNITEPPRLILGSQDHHNGAHIIDVPPLPPLRSGLQNLHKTAVKLNSSKLTKLQIDKKYFK